MSEQKILNIPARHILILRDIQRSVLAWAKAAFPGSEEVTSGVRALRFFEEACELMQVEGMKPSLLKAQIDEVYSRPVGTLHQEIGGVMITLMSYAEVKNEGVLDALDVEIHRINLKPVEHFQQRQREKMEKGLRS